MKINHEMRQQVARNILTAMELAGVENPNQFDKLTRKISVQQVRNILNCVSGATVDSLLYIADALGTKPTFLVADEAIRRSMAQGQAAPADISTVIYAMCGTTAEGRQMILNIAAMVPARENTAPARSTDRTE